MKIKKFTWKVGVTEPVWYVYIFSNFRPFIIMPCNSLLTIMVMSTIINFFVAKQTIFFVAKQTIWKVKYWISTKSITQQDIEGVWSLSGHHCFIMFLFMEWIKGRVQNPVKNLRSRCYPANIYLLFKVNNRNTRKSSEICSKSTINYDSGVKTGFFIPSFSPVNEY